MLARKKRIEDRFYEHIKRNKLDRKNMLAKYKIYDTKFEFKIQTIPGGTA